MKNFSVFFVFLSFIILFNNNILGANPGLQESYDQEIYYYDQGEEIHPEVDHHRLYVVFGDKNIQENIQSMRAISHKLIALDNSENSLYSSSSKSFSIEETNPNKRSSIINQIKLLPEVMSVYPYLLKGNDIASVDNHLILSLEPTKKENFISEYLKENYVIEDIIDLGNSINLVLEIPKTENVFSVAARFWGITGVIASQPNFIFRGKSHFDPNDAYYASQWFLKQDSDADIDADLAWDITQGAGSSVIAVIDGNGYDLNQAEMQTKYISPYCAVNDNNDPSAVHADENHGTPCAGLIGALTNNNTGVASVGFYCIVMPIRIGHSFNGGSFQTSSNIIIRAASHVTGTTYNTFAVSNSIGLGTWANIDAVRNAYESMRTQPRNGKGAVILASTGNDDGNGLEQYPCFFPNVVGVGATNSTDQRAYFSNYGDSCDMVAPGLSLWTIDRAGADGYDFGDYYEFSGTSAATPVVAGVVGLMGTAFPSYTEGQLRVKLYTACEKVGGYSYGSNPLYPFGSWNNEMGYGRINAFLALQAPSNLDPPENLQANLSGNNVSLSWEAPGGGGGSTEELIYDNNNVTGTYYWVSATMSTHMSPSQACKILNLYYYTSGSGTFNVEIYNWNGSQPGTTSIYSTSATAVDNDWVTVDLSSANVNLSGDFVAGYGSTSESNSIGYDADLNNGRSWDLSGGSWSSWNEAYLIRAEVEYSDGSREVIGNVPDISISIDFAISDKVSQKTHGSQIIQPIQNQSQVLRGLLGYNVYRNGNKINSNVITNTSYADNGLSAGTYTYIATAVYDEGESGPSNSQEVTVSGTSLDPPTNLSAYNNDNEVSLSWTPPGGGGGTEELVYDNNSASGAYQYVGYTMSTHMSPSAPCKLLTLKYYTTIDPGDNTFNARVFYWEDSQPDTDIVFEENCTAIEDDWFVLDVSAYNINFTNDFVVGFGSTNETTFLAYDSELDNGRSWDYSENGNSWSSWDEAYLIRAEVQYASGEREVLNMAAGTQLAEDFRKSTKDILENKEFVKTDPIANQNLMLNALQGYKLYRDGNYIKTLDNPFTSDILPSPGTYTYTVTALYSEGESDPTSPVSVTWESGFGIDENGFSSQVDVFPIPTDGEFSLSSPENLIKIKIYDYTGLLIAEKNTNSKTLQLKLSYASPGVYFLYFETQNNKGLKKLIIQ